MTYNHRTRGIQAIDWRVLAPAIDRSPDILEGSGIAAARLIGATISKAPDRDPT